MSRLQSQSEVQRSSYYILGGSINLLGTQALALSRLGDLEIEQPCEWTTWNYGDQSIPLPALDD